MKKINKDQKIYSQTISFTENSLLPLLYGEHDKFLRLIEQEMSISIITRGNFLKLSGNDSSVEIAKNLLNHLYENVKKNNFLDEGEVKGTINIFRDSTNKIYSKIKNIDSLSFTAGKRLIKPRSKKQVEYFNLVKKERPCILLWTSGNW